MTSGPESAGVDHINAHGKEHFGGILECNWTDKKGRIVHATRDWTQGDVILVEPPCHIVQEDVSSKAFKKLQQMCKKHKFDYEPLWYWCALKSLTKDQMEGAFEGGWDAATALQQKNLLLLHHEVTEAGRESTMMVEELVPNCDALILERLTQVWVLNCFEYSDSPTGYSVYFFSSFMSHSCFPNAVWHYTGSDHVLRARRNIKVGDEVCIAYLPEDGLLNPTVLRRHELHQTKHFWCDCERCAGSEDATRGVFCPKCKTGTVFSSATDPENNRKDYLFSAWTARQCNSAKCGHALTETQAKEISDYENKMKKILDDGIDKADKNDVKGAQDKEKWMKEVFSQHYLADMFWEQAADFYAKNGAYSEQRRVLQSRCAFHKASYPGLSGTHAWSLEALGDVQRYPAPPPSSASAKAKGQARAAPGVKADMPAAEKSYVESLRILKLMFGEDHEYVVSVADKLKTLQSGVAEEEK